ncbi:hypothetical protein D9C73_027485 [Collichthys lucidus]|uniref:Uncharacterized protein n=1 Tax=Collichthys lucidus TaxID=240159 RepID=A0A4U5VV66_COLLU|nr:hypothetical protein D9C73_027485 [Collichthys lucidus]
MIPAIRKRSSNKERPFFTFTASSQAEPSALPVAAHSPPPDKSELSRENMDVLPGWEDEMGEGGWGRKKRVDGPFVIGRVGGALSEAFQTAGAYSKAGVSAPPPGVFVPSPRFPHSPAGQKIRAAFGGFVLRLNPFTDRLLSHGNGREPRTG